MERPKSKGTRAPRVPRTKGDGHLTEAGYWGFIRSGLRAKFVRWWPRFAVLRDARRKSQSANKRLSWEFQCSHCQGWYAQKQVEVNHKIPCGTLKSYNDLPRFVERLFCEKDGLEVVCKPCHLEFTKESQ